MSEFSQQDNVYMLAALQQARQGIRTTSPNPAVGCVIVKHNEIIGRGWHRRAGEAHAEVLALADAGKRAAGADVYVTLEPCSHHGRTPPCADALVQAGVGRVVVAMQDPNPQVAGRGIQRLRDAGIEVQTGCLQTEAQNLNQGFVQRMQRGRPRVVSKIAMSLDGRTALANGQSKWITGADARADVHRLRARSCAILTGINTVMADNPALNVRLMDETVERQPDVVIVDTHLGLSPEAAVLCVPGRRVCVATASQDASRRQALEAAGAKILTVSTGIENGRGKHINLVELLTTVATEYEYNELMVEAGARLNGALLAAGLIDELVIYQAPVVLGDQGRAIFQLHELTSMDEVITLTEIESVRTGKDRKMVFVPESRKDG